MTAGVMAVLDPLVLCVILGTFIIVVLISRIVSLGSVAAAVVYPFATLTIGLLMNRNTPFMDAILALFISVLVIYMHRANIKRLLNHTEPKLGQKKEN